MNDHLITLMVFLPLFGVLLLAFVPTKWMCGVAADTAGRWIALAASVAASICGVLLVATMSNQPDLQAIDSFSWVGSYAIRYEMGVDGLNALFVLLISILFPVLIASEWKQKSGIRGMLGLFLVLQTAFFGTVCAQDLFLIFFFWGLTALPIYFLIGIWGTDGHESAAFRSVIASSIGNALVFAALLIVYYSVEPHSFSLHELAGAKLAGKSFELLGYDLSVPLVSFILISVGLALRAPLWPLHGWFTKVSQDAPSSVLICLTGVSAPVTIYLFIRLCFSLFPETVANAAPIILIVGLVNLFIGGVCAAAQRNLRMLLAFMTLSEVGLVLVGLGSLSAAGVTGAVYQSLVLGVGLAGFGLFAGVMMDRAGNSTFIEAQGKPSFGGVVMRAPIAAMFSGVIIASLLAFPGSGGFVGSALLMIGSYSAHPLTILVAGLALLFAIYYLLTMYRSVFLGKNGPNSESFSDLTFRERSFFMPVVLAIIFCGFYPKPFLDLVRPTVLTLLSTVK